MRLWKSGERQTSIESKFARLATIDGRPWTLDVQVQNNKAAPPRVLQPAGPWYPVNPFKLPLENSQ